MTEPLRPEVDAKGARRARILRTWTVPVLCTLFLLHLIGDLARGCALPHEAPTAPRPEPPRAFAGVLSPSPGVSIASLNAAIPGTENGQLLAWDGTTYALNRYFGDPSKRYLLLEEFETVTSGANCAFIGKFVGATTGGSCTYTGAQGLGHPGVLAITTDTTATNGSRASIVAPIQFGEGIGQACAKQLVMFPVLSTSVIQYVFRAGFNEPTAPNTDSVDAVEAVYQFSANANKWALTTSSNSVRTTTKCDGTGGTVDAPVVAGTWYTVEECVNAAGTSSTLAVNGTVCATNTTNIPTGSTRTTSLGFQCANDTGSVPAAEICNIDYFMATLPFGVAR